MRLFRIGADGPTGRTMGQDLIVGPGGTSPINEGDLAVQTLQVTQRTGKDGVLQVSIPLGAPEADFDVVLIVQPKRTEPVPASPNEGG
jgi:hypothetical protein